MSAIQLELFEEINDITLIQKQLTDMQESNANVRRGVFARLNSLGELVLKQQAEIDLLKQKIREGFNV